MTAQTASAPAPAKPSTTTSSGGTTSTDPQQSTSLLVHLLLWAQCAAELLCFALGLVVEALVTYVLPSRDKTRQYVEQARRILGKAVRLVLRLLKNALAGKKTKMEEAVKKKSE